MNSLSDSLLTPLSSGGAAAGALQGDAPPKGGDGASAGAAGRGPGSFATVLGQMQDGREGAQANAEPVDAEAGDASSDAPQVPLDAPVEAPTQRQEIATALAMQWAALVRGGPQDGEAMGADPVGRPGPPGQQSPQCPLGLQDQQDQQDPGTVSGSTVTELELDSDSGADSATKAGIELGAALPFGPPVHAMGLDLNAGADLESVQTGESTAGGQPGTGSEVSGGAWSGAGAAGPLWMPDTGQAAPVLDPGQATPARGWSSDAGLPRLMALQISPQLAVITPATSPAASDRSLLAYAAGQGFDAHALQRIFGAQAVQAMPEGMPEGAAPVLAAALPGAASTGTPVRRADAASAGQGMALGAAPQANSLAQALEAFHSDGGQVQARPGGAGSEFLNGLSGPTTGPTTGPTGPTGSGSAPVTAWAALQARGGGAEGGWATAGLLATAAATATIGGSLRPAGSPIGAGFMPADLALTAAGAAPSAGAADGAAAPTPTGMASAAASSALAAPTETASPTLRHDTAARPLDSQPIDLRQHLEQGHEALSRRLGEALAARLISQVERGDWQIRLSVAPQHLGPIDIDLQMRGSRIDAQFQVAHGQTQALIQDSLPRLREAVGASGMDLASVWVSGGWNERNRGNPTPGQPDDPAPGAFKEGGGDEQTVAAVASVDTNGPGRTPRPGAVDILI